MTDIGVNVEDLPNLASSQLGTEIVFASDEWFAEAPNMLQDAPAVFDENTFTEYGKEMDGWESRRRRTEGHDWCIIQLGTPGFIDAIEIDTLWFTGNFSPKSSVTATYFDPDQMPQAIADLKRIRAEVIEGRGEKSAHGRQGTCATQEEMALALSLQSHNWTELIPLQPLGAGYPETSRNLFKINAKGKRFNFIRLNQGPDGGIARLRVYGRISISPDRLPRNKEIDLASVNVGGLALGASNAHYGHARNLCNPGRGKVMGDGWETARQPKRPPAYERGDDGLMLLPGFDWAVLQLGVPGVIKRVEVDTHLYKGNYPESCLIEGCYQPGGKSKDLALDDNKPEMGWQTILPRSRLRAHEIHRFDIGGLANNVPFTHVKITIYPDGGVQRLRVYGYPAAAPSPKL
jgi:allantoicase